MKLDAGKLWSEIFKNLWPIAALALSSFALAHSCGVQKEADRRTREANREDERIRLDISLNAAKEPIFYNHGSLEAIDIEILEHDYWYSPSCQMVLAATPSPWAGSIRRVDRLGPFETRKLDLGDAGSDTLAPSLWDNIWCIPGERMVEGPGDAGTNTPRVCPPESPCRLVRHIRARAKHPKTYRWSDWTEEFFATMPDSHLISSSEFMKQRGHITDEGGIVSELTWKSPADQHMFTEVNQTRVRQAQEADLVAIVQAIYSGPFMGLGIEAATSADGGVTLKKWSPEEVQKLTGSAAGR